MWALVRAAGSDQDAALYLTAAFTGLRMGSCSRCNGATSTFWVEPEDLVFANELGTYQDASSIRIRYRAALTRAGLRRLRFHDLRHTFGTLAVRRAEVPAVQAWMGHSEIAS